MTDPPRRPKVTPSALRRAERHVMEVLNERDARYAEAMAAQKEAVIKAEVATERRFESVNEFRNQMGDMQRTLMPRSESEQRMANLEKQLDSLEGLMSESRARLRGGKEMWAYIIGAVGLLLAIASFAATIILR
jgi:hypothetical protein